MSAGRQWPDEPRGPSRAALTRALRPLGAAMLGALLAVVAVACSGSSANRLIPLADAGPLKGDVSAVEHAAEEGHGDCSATEAAIAKAESDYAALPSTLDSGLRNSLHQGIANLRTRSLALCAQLDTTSTGTVGTTAKPSTATTTTTTSTTPPPTATEPSTTTPGGGTPAEESEQEAPTGGAESGAAEQGAGSVGGVGGVTEGEGAGANAGEGAGVGGSGSGGGGGNAQEGGR